ncbi:MAG TPA: hypothetical protein VMA77_04825 [Solirubrobacteraceae bacterium]|nr:hypothetical protein [Solirubrobacteraceae bacterium]
MGLWAERVVRIGDLVLDATSTSSTCAEGLPDPGAGVLYVALGELVAPPRGRFDSSATRRSSPGNSAECLSGPDPEGPGAEGPLSVSSREPLEPDAVRG